MAFSLDPRPILLNGVDVTADTGQAVVDDSGDVYLPEALVLKTGAFINNGASITIDRLPMVSVVKSGDTTQVVRVPGSPAFDTGVRSTPISQTDANGNELALTAQVTDGQLTNLSGTLTFTDKNVTANVTFTFADGVLKPSGTISFASGDFTIKITANDGAYSGDLEYNAPGVNVSLTVAAGNDQPTTLGLSVTVHF
ncbi:MAG TPA: hypothetical protein VKU00_10305 [Chthonomonadaceae bacterium]|nr:hypothetical protein [Chthonomonadaceae bacterium]